MNIHRYHEASLPDMGFLHDVEYVVDSKSKAFVKSLQTHLVVEGVVGDLVISHDDPLSEVTAVAAYSILLKDNVIDENANYLIKH